MHTLLNRTETGVILIHVKGVTSIRPRLYMCHHFLPFDIHESGIRIALFGPSLNKSI